jgi:tetratricopeptide (TPR) repeat protein
MLKSRLLCLLSILLFCVMVFSAGVAYAGKPIPTDKDSYTMPRWDKEVEAYVVGRMDLYDKHTKDPVEVRKSVKDFAQKLLKCAQNEPGALTWKELVEPADKLLSDGESDPLVLTDIGFVKLKLSSDDAIGIFKKAIENYSSSTYPACAKFHPYKMLRWICNEIKDRETWDPYREDFIKQMVAIMVESADEPQNRRAAWNEIGECLEIQGDSPGMFAQQTAIYELVLKAEKIDPWMKTMVEGWHHCGLAWKLRGNGFSNTVTPEGFKGFAENIAKSSEYFTKAWEMEPKYPEAPTAMIHISMSGGDGKHSPRDWFDRAVEAQMDFKPAYDALIWSLRPRWGGSHIAMYQFGLECLATKRFDTAVPERLIDILLDIESEIGDEGDIWKEDEVFDHIKALIEGIENEPTRRNNSNLEVRRMEIVLSAGFLIALEARQYDEARKILDKLGDKIVQEDFRTFKRHYPYDVARTYALTGSSGGAVKNFDLLVADGGACDPETRKKAEEILSKAAEQDSNDKAKFYFDYWKTGLDALDQFEKGEWVELTFDKPLMKWEPVCGEWNVLDEHGISSVGDKEKPQQGLKCTIPFAAPYEIECDLEFSAQEEGILTGLMLNNLWKMKGAEPLALLGVNPGSKEVLFTIPNVSAKQKKYEVADPGKCHIHLKYWNPKFEFSADGQTIPYFDLPTVIPNDTFLLISTAHGKQTFKNVRIRKMSTDPPAAEKK